MKRSRQMLVASHIKPYSQCRSEADRVSPDNGICLNTFYDKAFDRGLITITPSMKIYVSPIILDSPQDAFTARWLASLAAMLNELFPDAKNIGLLYCSAEANSQYQVDTVKAELEKLGYTCEYYAFSDSNDLSSVATTATDASDVIYVPTDNTVASNTEIINNICLPAKVPVITGEEGICSGCGVATLSISYYDLGVTTGKMAVKILKDGEDISTMPIEYAPNFTKEYNKDICEELGIEVPDDYVAIGEAAEETAK